MSEIRRVAAIVLAAGAASRFGSPKALAPLEGRPLLQHVLDALHEAGISDVTVVLGVAADEVEAAIDWRGERRIPNANPARGLASSLKVGLATLPGDVEAALVALGDQPRLRPEVIDTLIARWQVGSNAIVVPRYSASGTLNPVLLGRPAWPLAMVLDGDRGMGPIIHAAPHLVTEVAVEGDNPDVDTPADLARLAGPGSGSGPGEGSR